MRPTSLLLAGICAAGLVSGVAVKRLSHRPSAAASAKPAGAAATPTPERIRPGRAASLKPLAIPHARSTESVESLLAADADGLYGKLAAWLSDASESDIATFWDSYKQQSGRSNDIIDLVFLNWARLNPQAAIDANAGTKDEHYAWWAWAAHDPQAAYAKALATNADRVNNVAWGIGEFHPEWLRAHYKELSDGARSNAIRGMSKWEDRQDPLASLKFMQEIGETPGIGTLKALARQDPWAALDWLKNHPNPHFSYRGSYSQPMDQVIQTIAEERPEELALLIKQTPSGQAKVKMEAALFNQLADSDPAAALEQARATTAPYVAAERYATLAMQVVRSDPDQAYELAAALLKACPDAMQPMAMVDYPNGGTGYGLEIAGVQDLFGILSSRDPARLVEMTIGLPVGRYGMDAFTRSTQAWASQDLAGYSDWVNRQSNPDTRDRAASMIVNQLQQDGQYAEAIEWRMSMRQGEADIDYLVQQWHQSEPDQSSEWLESSTLSEERKQALRNLLK